MSDVAVGSCIDATGQNYSRTHVSSCVFGAEGENLERRRMMSLGTLQGTEDSGLTSFSNGSSAATHSSGTTHSSDENHSGGGEWNGDMG